MTTARKKEQAAKPVSSLPPATTPNCSPSFYFTRYVTWEIVLRAFSGIINSKTAAKDQLKNSSASWDCFASPRVSPSMIPTCIR